MHEIELTSACFFGGSPEFEFMNVHWDAHDVSARGATKGEKLWEQYKEVNEKRGALKNTDSVAMDGGSNVCAETGTKQSFAIRFEKFKCTCNEPGTSQRCLLHSDSLVMGAMVKQLNQEAPKFIKLVQKMHSYFSMSAQQSDTFRRASDEFHR